MTAPSILVLVSYKVFPAEMGGQKCVTEFYEHVAAQTKVVLAVAKENQVTQTVPYQVFPFLYNHWWGVLIVFYLYRLTKLIKAQAIDVIIVEHSYFGWLGLLLRWFTEKPIVIRSHNIDALRFCDTRRPWWRLSERHEKRVHREVNHSFIITEEDKVWVINTCKQDFRTGQVIA